MKNKSNKKHKTSRIIGIIGKILIIFGIIFIGIGVTEYTPVILSNTETDYIRPALDKNEDPLYRKINFRQLKAYNADIIGWIYIPGTTIDYPIMQGRSDTEYLWKGQDGRQSEVGSIFTFADEKSDFSMANPYIFGHTMSFNCMFGELKCYTQEASYRKDKNFAYIYTPNNAYEVQLYSVFTCLYTDDIFTHNMKQDTDEYAKRIDEYISRNQYSDIKKPNLKTQWRKIKTFTFSTCQGTVGTKQRLTMHWINTRTKEKI